MDGSGGVSTSTHRVTGPHHESVVQVDLKPSDVDLSGGQVCGPGQDAGGGAAPSPLVTCLARPLPAIHSVGHFGSAAQVGGWVPVQGQGGVIELMVPQIDRL